MRLLLEPRQRDGHIPASHSQRRLWFLDKLQDGKSTAYNRLYALRLRGPLDRSALTRGIEAIVQRHESLRTRFVEEDGEPTQIVMPSGRLTIPVMDFTDLGPDAQHRRIQEQLRREYEEPFDLSRGPLMRLSLLQLGPHDHILVRGIHHIVFDAWSQAIWNRELRTLYAAFHRDQPTCLSPLPLQYSDFAMCERRWLGSGALDASVKYWRKQLAGAPDRLDIPLDRTRPSLQTEEARQYRVRMAAAETIAVERFSHSRHATLYMTLLAAIGVVMARYSGQDDVVIGSVLATRQDKRLQQLIGFFVNSVPMRILVDPRLTLDGLLAQVRRTAVEAYQHQHVPFDRLVEAQAPTRTLDAHPMFQVQIRFQNTEWAPPHLADIDVSNVHAETSRIGLDIDIQAIKRGDALELTWIYNASLFDERRIAQMARHHLCVVAMLAGDPAGRVGNISLLDQTEHEQIVSRWSAREAVASDAPETVPAMFEQQVDLSPDSIAVVSGERAIAYRELNSHANRLARELIMMNAGPEKVIAISCDRTVEMLIATLAVLKAGAAYVHLDREHPTRRTAEILAQAMPLCIVTTAADAGRWRGRHKLIVLDDPDVIGQTEAGDGRNVDDEDRIRTLHPLHPAYLISTSGSSGNPKLVVGLHRGLVNRIKWFHALRPLTPDTPVLAKTSLGFVDATTELLGPLLVGGSVVLAETPASANCDRLADLVRKHGIRQITVVPTLLAAILDEWSSDDIRRCRWICSGEHLQPALAERFARQYPDTELFNLYGMSEASGDSLWGKCDGPDGAFEAPVRNTQVYLLDDDLNPVPIGVSGGVYIGGDGLARGYLNGPRLTAERFVPNPFGAPGSRLYRTGDLARWRHDLKLEFLGRADRQVKVAGIRVELNEVEAALLEREGIREAAVVVREQGGVASLAAYVVAAPAAIVEPSQLRQALRDRLPGYMIPGSIAVVPTLPRLPSGKIDRSRLPGPSEQRPVRSAPSTPEEEALCEIIAELFDLNRVGPEADFFELGGHSMQAIRLVNRIRRLLGIELATRAVFDTPRICDLARQIRDARNNSHLAPIH